MSVKTAAVVVLFLSGWVGCEEADLGEVRLKVAEASNAFSAYLYQALRTEPGNIILSPFSVANLLAMLWVGAGGYSAHELITALRLPDDRLQIEGGFRALISSLKQPVSEPGITLDIANKVFIENGYPVHSSFRRSIMTNFLSDIQHVDFMDKTEDARVTINKWVEQATHDKIKDLIQEGTLDPNTNLILTNALYFKGDWLNPFIESENVEEPFFLARGHYKNVPMMYQASKFYVHTFKELSGLRVLKLPYSNEVLSMVILLPKTKTGLDCLEGRLPLLNIKNMLGKLKKRNVEVTIPKFKVEKKLELMDSLLKMGIQEVFGDKANLSGIADGPLYVKKIVQKSFIEVSENGTEAAAASEMEVVMRSGPNYASFKVNHPFLFLIYDERSQTILFMGRVLDPVRTEDNTRSP